MLVRNERYWGRKPALQQITIKVIPDATSRAVAFETGEIDMLYGDEGLLPLDTFERFRHHPGYVARLSAPAETVMLALNASQGPTREQAVREALNYAVDKQTLVDSVLYGTQQVADTLFAPSVPYAPQDLTPRRYDPTKARALLEQAGWQQLEGQPWRQKPGNRWRLSWRLLAPTRWLNRWPKLFRPICGRSACRSPWWARRKAAFTRASAKAASA